MQWGFRHSLVAAAIALPCLMGMVAVSEAATDSKPLSLTKYAKHHGHKKVVHRYTRSKTAKAKAEALKRSAAANDDADDSASDKSLPSNVANARAELNAGDTTPKPSASTLTASDKIASPASADSGVEVAASDQLNDMDRDVANQPAPAAEAAPTPAPAAPAVTAPVYRPASSEAQQVSTRQTGAWDSASLIGKIFVAFGTMLTLASAARLIIA